MNNFQFLSAQKKLLNERSFVCAIFKLTVNAFSFELYCVLIVQKVQGPYMCMYERVLYFGRRERERDEGPRDKTGYAP